MTRTPLYDTLLNQKNHVNSMNIRSDAIRFTVEERILLHLLDYTTYHKQIEVPPSLTQEGIAQSIHIHRKHLPRTLKNMIQKNHITEKTAHVIGKTQRMKTYHLTINGQAKALELKNCILTLPIAIRDTQGQLKKTTINNAQQIIQGINSLAEILSCINQDGIIDLTKTVEKPPLQQKKQGRLYIYRKALEQAWKDGKMTRSERDILQNLRNSLNISEKQHLKMEEQILEKVEKNPTSEAAQVYKIALEQALADKHISKDERAILEKIRKHFNLKDF